MVRGGQSPTGESCSVRGQFELSSTFQINVGLLSSVAILSQFVRMSNLTIIHFRLVPCLTLATLPELDPVAVLVHDTTSEPELVDSFMDSVEGQLGEVDFGNVVVHTAPSEDKRPDSYTMPLKLWLKALYVVAKSTDRNWKQVPGVVPAVDSANCFEVSHILVQVILKFKL